jgi:demethylmenaquinone methyltransferase/2-methoxy-6-polyprenyl-1,4-benzoquinol methylase
MIGGGGRGELKRVAGRLFSGLAISYDRVLDWTTLMQDRHWKSWAIERASPTASDLALDIGCGTCVTEERMRSVGCQVVGLDLTDEMLRLGKAKGLRRVALLRGDAESLPFPDASFDVVVSFYVAKYCDLERFVSEASRVLKQDGRLVIYDFTRPRGMASPLLAIYIYGFLKLAGRLSRRLDDGVSYTFEKLPEIVRGTSWDTELPPLLGHHHLVIEDQVSLSGGAVRAFAMRKRQATMVLEQQPLENN